MLNLLPDDTAKSNALSTDAQSEYEKLQDENTKLHKTMTDLLEVKKLLTKTIKDTRNAPGDEESLQCRTRAEARTSIDNGKKRVDGESNRAEAKDEKASHPTAQPEDTNAGGDNVPIFNGEPCAELLEDKDGTTDHPNEKKRRKQNRGGAAARAAKKAAYDEKDKGGRRQRCR